MTCSLAKINLDYFTFLRVPCRTRRKFVDTAMQIAEARKKEYEQIQRLNQHGNRNGF